MRLMIAGKVLVLGLLGMLATASMAQELRLGLAAEVTSLDPHFINIAPNVAFATQVFDTLIAVDADGHLVPGLALSWRAVNATTWEVKLRQHVKFHDGSEFTAQDALFSLRRPSLLSNSPGPFTSSTRMIVAMEAPDPYTLRVHTASAYGALPLDLSSIFIVSKKVAHSASNADFDSGLAMIGTGPFRFVSYRRGDAIVLARNDSYWGDKPAWDKVTLRMLPNPAARSAALLAGDVDAIESVAPADVALLRGKPGLSLEQKVSWRTLMWVLDQRAGPVAEITDLAGKPLPRNPLADRRVREALSLAINRPALAERTLEGLAVPAANLVVPGILGHDPALSVDPYDVAVARKLLAEAGYGQGFALTLHGPNNRYINDAQVAQTVAQFLSRIGIRAKVDTVPIAVYLGHARAGEYDMALLGWGSLAGDFTLRALLGTIDPDTGWGSWNWGHYHNPELDGLVHAALASTDAVAREGRARAAMALAMHDYAVIPLYHQYATWAMRKGLTYTARVDEFTLAQGFRPQ